MLIRSWYGRVWREERADEGLRYLVVVGVDFDQAFVCAEDVAWHLVKEDGYAERR